MKRRILILGSGGQIGAYLSDYLKDKGYEVLEFDIVIVGVSGSRSVYRPN